MTDFDELLEEVLNILDSGPKTYQEIVEHLLQVGLLDEDDQDHEDLIEVLEDSAEIWCSLHGFYNRYDHMVDGVYLTHRLSDEEITSGTVSLYPDFLGLDVDLDEFIFEHEANLEVVPSDDPFDIDRPNEGILKGPSGWLSSYSAGDLIGIQRVGSSFRISSPKTASSGEAERASFAEVVERIIENHDGIGFGLSELLLRTLCDYPALFRTPVPPLSELISGLGLETRGHWFGRRGEKWVTPGEKVDEIRKKQIFGEYGFNNCCISAFEKVMRAWQDWKVENKSDIDKSAFLKALSHGAVADGLIGYISGPLFQVFNGPSFGEFIDSFTSVNRPEVASAYYVRAMLKEVAGDALGAEQDLHSALRFDPNFEPAVLELAYYEADRGNYGAYLSRLQRCDPELVSPDLEFAYSLYPRVTSVERNDPCPCGSGRKYKACCLNGPKLSEHALRAWLMYRISRWMLKPHVRTVFATSMRTFENITDADPEPYISFVLDAVMFEAGGIDDYLEHRHDLLSEHDLNLVQQLAESKRALYEIVEVARGETMVLRDVLTGDVTVVSEFLGSLDAQVGGYLLGRVIESDEGAILVGESLSVDLVHRRSLLDLLVDEYDSMDLIIWLANTLTSPQLVNFDGDEIVLCKARIGIRNPNAETLYAKLDSHFERTEDDTWSVMKTTSRGDEMSGGWMRIEDGELIVETNSVQRLDWILGELEKAIGEFEVIERSQQSLEEARANTSVPDQEMWPEDVREQVRQAVDKRIDEMEDKWLTESIPALGGLSPRQALDDPTRKQDLLRLLNEFEREEQKFNETADPTGRIGGGFKTARLRAKLGL